MLTGRIKSVCQSTGLPDFWHGAAYGSRLGGQRTFFLLTQALWPVPLVAYAGGGGLWGLAAAPVTLLFRFMWISPWFIIVGTFVCTCISSWTGWSWLQPLGVIACAFLLYDFRAFSRSSGRNGPRVPCAANCPSEHTDSLPFCESFVVRHTSLLGAPLHCMRHDLFFYWKYAEAALEFWSMK